MSRNSDTKRNIITSTFTKGMNQDAIDSLVPKGYYKSAWNSVLETDDEHSFGISSENSNRLHTLLPQGAILRGLHNVEERDRLYTFILNGGTSEIGYIDLIRETYTSVYDECDMDFGVDTWIPVESKVIQPCNELILYWAVNDYYYRLNVDNTDEVEDCEDILLFRRNNVGVVDASVNDKGGQDLSGGAYDIVVQLEDKDGNVTNWFNFSQTVHLGTQNNTSDEISEESINIRIANLSPFYDYVNIGVFHNGNTVGTVVAQLPYTTNGVDFFYSSKNQYIRDLTISEVLGRKDGWLRGSDLIQYDSRLFLYNLRGERNLDYQERALRIRPTYIVGRVPMKYAYKFKGFRHGEVYSVSIHWNYTDGTRTRAFHIGNFEAPPASSEDCNGCGGSFSGNNAQRTTTYTGNSVESDSESAQRVFTNPDQQYEPFVPTDQGVLSSEDASIPDYSNVPNPSADSGDGDCDCDVYCIMANSAKQRIISTLAAPYAGLNSSRELEAAFNLLSRTCDCDCDGISGGLEQEGLQPLSGLPSSSDYSFNDDDVTLLLNFLNLQYKVQQGTLAEADVKEILESTFTYDAAGDSLIEYTPDGNTVTFRGVSSDIDVDLSSEGGAEGNQETIGDISDCEGLDYPSGDEPQPSSALQPNQNLGDEEDADSPDTDPYCDEFDTTTGGDVPSDVGQNNTSNEIVDPEDNGTGRGVTTGMGEEDSDFTTVSNDCEPQIIYEEGDCCKVKKIIPCIDAEGTLSGWESCETYPTTKRCDIDGKGDENIYVDKAGTPIRHLKMPTVNIEPHFISYQDGVPTEYNMDNSEEKDSYARFLWLKFYDIEPPREEELDKPLNEENPFTINIVQRDESNKSIKASGLFRGTFKGRVHNEEYLFPKNGVNSVETVSRYVEDIGSEFGDKRGDINNLASAYTFLSPDTQFNRPNINSDRVNFLMELRGQGFRHGLYAEGIDPDSYFVDTKHSKGSRAAINLNHYAAATNIFESSCIKAASYAPANKTIDKGDNFTTSLINLHRESSVYIETEGPYRDKWDGSFVGDVNQHQRVLNGIGDYGDIVEDIPNQYGRLEDQIYVPIYQGTKDDLANGSCEVRTGDSYINLFSVKTTSYVSDRVGVNPRNKSIAKSLEFGGGFVGRILNRLLSRFFNTIGAEKCGTIPEQGLEAATLDPRANDDLNGLRDGGADIIVGGSPVLPERDTYFPQVQKTLVTFPVVSDVNLYYRKGGETEETAFYKDLNGLSLDSSFVNSEGGYDNSYLDQFWSVMSEIAPGKMISRVITNILFTYVVGFYFFFKGINIGAEAIYNATYGLCNSIGLPFALASSIALTLLGISWVIGWANTNLDNKFWDNVLGIPDCFPDEFLADDKYKMEDDRVERYRDDYYAYEYESYSRFNNFDLSFGQPINYNTCDCLNEKTLKIVYSDPQDPTSWIDAYRNYRVNNYLDIEASAGFISRMFKRSNKLYVHTSDTIYSLESGARSMKTNDGDSIYLGRGNVVQRPINLFAGVEEGYAGNIDPNAALNTNIAYVWVDRKARKIFMFTSGGMKELGSATMRSFLRNNLDLELLKAFPDFDLVDEKTPSGVGYNIGVDYRHDRILITKIDFKPHEGVSFADGVCTYQGEEVPLGDPSCFTDVSWTLSYSFTAKNFISFHSYKPLVYAQTRGEFYSFGGDGLYMHNIEGKYRNFYGEQSDWIIDFALNNKDIDTFEYQNTTLYCESFIHDGKVFVGGEDKFTFDDVVVYNSYQNTGNLNFQDLGDADYDILSADYTDTDVMKLNYLPINKWRFGDVRNKIQNGNTRMFAFGDEVQPVEVNEENIGEVRDDDSFLDNHLGYILKMNKEENKKLLLKKVDTTVDCEIL